MPGEKDISDPVPAPDFQPQSVGQDQNRFSSAEIWWWNNGIWGEAGYAIPNDGGKPYSANETIRHIHAFLGAELFNLMHRPDVKFSRPFNADWLFDLNKMLTLGIKRMNDLSVNWTDNRQGDAQHAINTPESFVVFPVPYFGPRIRQADAKRWCGQMLLLLSEVMQHSDNDYDDDVTRFLAAMVQEKLLRIQRDMAMKYLAMEREAVESPEFAVPATAFAKGAYDPEALFTSREMIEERMPEYWWPQANDLTPINGIAQPVARQWASRWPIAADANLFGDSGAEEAAFPAGGNTTAESDTSVQTVQSQPGARPTE